MTALRHAVDIALLELRRFLRDRSNLFFVFVFPLLLVLFIGLQFGEGAAPDRAVVVGSSSTLRTDLVDQLTDDGLRVQLEEEDAALELVARSRAQVAVLIDADAVAAYDAGGDLELTVVPSSQLSAQAAAQQVDVTAAQLSTRQGQLVALTSRGVSPEDAEAALDQAGRQLQAPTVEVARVDELAAQFEGLGQFDIGASGQLLLFVFLSSLTGAVTLIQARRLGVVARTLTAPVKAGHLVLGEALGRFVIAMVQGTWIMVFSALFFNVNWGSIGVSLLVLSLFSMVAAGAAMVLGAMLDNEGAASGMGVGIGLVLGALGGSMMPLELFSDTMSTVSKFTPHAWAYEAFAEIQRRDAGVVEVLPQLAVLAAMAVALLVIGAWAVRRSMARAL